MQNQEIKKPKNSRTRRIVKTREPKEIEDVKCALFVCGHRSSSLGKEALVDLSRLKFDESVLLTRRHVGLAPFEEGGEFTLERLSQQKNCGLFVVANHTKSKPHNLVFGRFFDHHLYDMIELGIKSFLPIQHFAKSSSGYPLGAKPCFIFKGERFEKSEELKLLKEMFLDFFRGRVVDGVLLEGLQRLIVVTALSDEIIYFRQYCISPMKWMRDLVTIEDFVEVGPRFDFQLRRIRNASNELKNAAFPKLPTSKKVKNVSKDAMENKVGALYIPSQDVDKIITARPKGTKRQRRLERAEQHKAKRTKP